VNHFRIVGWRSAFRAAVAVAVISCLFGINAFINAQDKEIRLWPSPAPGTEQRQNLERWDEKKQLYNVYQPRLIVFVPENGGRKIPAVIVCPGGGYRNLAVEKEGNKIARWFNGNGIAAFVLLYRLDPATALVDGQRAVSVLRILADSLHIDGNRIGMMGFSAGAHLAANVATHLQKAEIRDAVDTVSHRPDFWIGVYGVYETCPKDEDVDPHSFSFTAFSSLITPDSPPAFLVHASDDPKVPALQSVHLYEAMKKIGIPAELHIYEKGGHGFALEEDRGEAVTSTVHSWSARCLQWLKMRGILTQQR
jgi:acetyl esterase/lipase